MQRPASSQHVNLQTAPPIHLARTHRRMEPSTLQQIGCPLDGGGAVTCQRHHEQNVLAAFVVQRPMREGAEFPTAGGATIERKAEAAASFRAGCGAATSKDGAQDDEAHAGASATRSLSAFTRSRMSEGYRTRGHAATASVLGYVAPRTTMPLGCRKGQASATRPEKRKVLAESPEHTRHHRQAGWHAVVRGPSDPGDTGGDFGRSI